MKHLTRSTLLSLVAPFLYATLTAVYFLIALQQAPIQPHHVVGVLVAALAFMLWMIARIQLGNSFTIGARAKKLITVGLYSKFRHPVYYFSILAVAGIAIFTWSIHMTIPVSMLIVIQILRIRREERVLERAFGEDYVKYKGTTWF